MGEIINISDDAGLKRKLDISDLHIRYGVYVKIEAKVLHFENVNGDYGNPLYRFDYLIEKNTVDSYIYTATGLTAVPTGEVDENGVMLFPNGKVLGVDVIPELLGLTSSDTYAAILAMQKGIIERLDFEGKIIKLGE